LQLVYNRGVDESSKVTGYLSCTLRNQLFNRKKPIKEMNSDIAILR